MILADTLRVAAIVNGLLSLWLSAASIYYFRKRNPPKQLQQHVVRVSALYVAFTVYGLVEIVTHLHQPFRWQLAALFSVFCLAVYAQIPLRDLERSSAHEAVS